MKLFTRYNRINLFATVIVFLLSGISFYFLLRYIVIAQVDEDLKIEQREIQTYAGKYQRLPEIITVRDQHINYTIVNKDGGKKTFSTVKMYDGQEKEKDIFRQLMFYINTGDQWYQVTVSKSLEGTDNMIQSIVTITLITILLILAVSFLVNRFVLRKLWQPFYDTLAAMRRFELGKKEQPAFPSTTINEFMVMNDTLKQATSKADQDYQSLKEFTENASHELQTPLAIIQSKLDVLIQDEHLSEPQSRAVQSAYEAIQRLSRLNQGLLLLTKIENGQYSETAVINISQKITEKIVQFEEMILAKNITVTTALDTAVTIKINPVLADILLNNLFSNAIKYNVQGGTIDIIADQGIIEISNAGDTTSLDTNRLFRRFGKTGLAKDGIGLGLAIVRQAAEVSGFETRYVYKDQQHHFLLVDSNL
ncbi:MAG TPA: HAMP domain-containing sensor histidine kinase [Chitinophagaceae bacterium]|nr:HAMP domain-containing sensor histidine kinase [Chitinophagaceae bacterium]